MYTVPLSLAAICLTVCALGQAADQPCPPPDPCQEATGLASDIRMRGFVPKFGSITTGSSVSAGIAYQWMAPGQLPLDWEVSGMISVRNYQTAGVRVGRLRARRQTYVTSPFGRRLSGEFGQDDPKEAGFVGFADANYFYFPQQSFFGFGPHSLERSRTDFLLGASTFEGVAGYQFNEHIGISARAGLMKVRIKPGRNPDYPDTPSVFPDIPGMDRQPDFYRMTAGVMFDYRDWPQDPQNGGLVGLLYSRYSERGGDQYRFNRYALDARRFIPISPVRSVLAFQFYTQVDRPIGDSQIPFYLMEVLGSGSALRGHSSQRFRDRNLLYLSGELRIRITEDVGIVPFYDTGKTFSDLGQYDVSDLAKAFGIGVRVKASPSLLLRLDLARSREGTDVHVGVGQTF